MVQILGHLNIFTRALYYFFMTSISFALVIRVKIDLFFRDVLYHFIYENTIKLALKHNRLNQQ